MLRHLSTCVPAGAIRAYLESDIAIEGTAIFANNSAGTDGGNKQGIRWGASNTARNSAGEIARHAYFVVVWELAVVP